MLAVSGCIQVSPHAEIIDCAVAFAEAVLARDLSAVADLTFNRPEGWEEVIANGEFALYDVSIVDVERMQERARVSIELREQPQETDEFDEVADDAELMTSETFTLAIELQRIDGTWLVDLGRTLGIE